MGNRKLYNTVSDCFVIVSVVVVVVVVTNIFLCEVYMK